MKTLFIIDDHGIVRLGLKEYLEVNTEWKITQTFSSAKDCIEFLEYESAKDKPVFPEVMIIDVQLIGETGFVLLKQITSRWPSIKCVMYSMYDTSGYILQAKDCGAKGYISKVSPEEELIKCLDIVDKGGTYLEAKMIESQLKLDSVISVLTKKEKIILELILQDKTNQQIMEEMNISLQTVQNYVSSIYDKAGVAGREDLIREYR